MSDPVTLRSVQASADIARLEAALHALSLELGEIYATDPATLQHALTGPQPSAQALLAVQGGQTLGAALFSPVFSTVRGAAGVYVSDLWVSAEARGQGLGARLLAQIARQGAATWQARWLKLAVYDHSLEAQKFYKRLGFERAEGAQEMRLGAEAVAQLVKRAG
ncbi:MAG TPA: GNAT family N-acetyltransferase [Paracoccus sp.]|nr:GNAT family N-acetyltransferase [Paracoccus sp. (in: a-proteobacteria)]